MDEQGRKDVTDDPKEARRIAAYVRRWPGMRGEFRKGYMEEVDRAYPSRGPARRRKGRGRRSRSK